MVQGGVAVTESTHVCRACGEAAEPHGPCSRCHEGGGRPDYFVVMGLPRRLAIDPVSLEATYHRMSREVHPDFHHQKPLVEREELLRRSALVNTAYRTLRDFHTRVAYLVELEGGDTLKPQAPPELLEDVLEAQDLLERYCEATPPERDRLAEEIRREAERFRERLTDLESNLRQRADEWDRVAESNSDDARGRSLRALHDLLSRRVYVINLIRDLEMGAPAGVSHA